MRNFAFLYGSKTAAFVALFSGLFSARAQALETFCVNSVSQLDTAYLASANDDVEIRLVTGAYTLTGSCFDLANTSCRVSDHAVRIRGGYNAGCASRIADPGATQLLATGSELAFFTPALSLDRLRLRSATSARLWPDESLSVDRAFFDDIGTVSFLADSITLRNSLFTRIGSGFPQGLDLSSESGSYLIEGNTFARNFKPVAIFPGSGVLRNNVFWDNGGVDLRFVAGDDPLEISVRNNLYGSATGLANLASAPTNTITSDPLFVNAALLDFRLQGVSPAINSGFPSSFLLTQLDFPGNLRWFGDAPDRGAFESAVGTTATTIVVQNTNDSGIGSLRQAIIDANAQPNVNRIEFDIGSTCGPRNIVLITSLPAISNSVVIDGYTQPGASRNTLANGSNAVRCIAITDGGVVSSGIRTSNNPDASVTIDGIGFGGFGFTAVYFEGGNGHRLIGSQVGGQMGPAASLLTLAPSSIGVLVGSPSGPITSGVQIGDETPQERNVFSDTTSTGVTIAASGEATRVVNNYIGVGPSGSLATDGNRDGVAISGRNNEVRANVISNNTRHGVLLLGANARSNQIRENRIGLPALCVILCDVTLGNDEDGVRFDDQASNNRVERNSIQYNGDDGVVLAGGVENAILRNVIIDNGQQPIDLGDDGTSADGNNALPPAGAANFGQNRPGLTAAAGNSAQGRAQGSLASANGSYRIDFYDAINCAVLPIPPIPGGQPVTWLGSSTITISNGTATTNGTMDFDLPIIVPGDTNFFATPRRIVATATKLSTGVFVVPRSTSEVSSCVAYDSRLFADGFEG